MSARCPTTWEEILEWISWNIKSAHCSFKWWWGEGGEEREREWGREGRCRISRGLLPAICVGEVCGMGRKEEDRVTPVGACLTGAFMEDLPLVQCFFSMKQRHESLTSLDWCSLPNSSTGEEKSARTRTSDFLNISNNSTDFLQWTEGPYFPLRRSTSKDTINHWL